MRHPICVLAFILCSASVPSHATTVPCATHLDGWKQISEPAYPGFMSDGKQELEGLLVCGEGVIFVFATRAAGEYRRFVVSVPRPGNMEGVESVLRKHYDEGRLVTFNNQRRVPRIKTDAAGSVTLEWRGREVSFDGTPGLYVGPETKVSGWVLFLVLWPGPR